MAEVRARIAADGFDLKAVLEFVDDGYSGSTLARPAMERLRDVAAAGSIDRLYVHCPDRFARHYAYQVLVVDELTRQGVEVIFLNRPLGPTAEDQLLLQGQGVKALVRAGPRSSNGAAEASGMPHKRDAWASSAMLPMDTAL